MNLSASLYDQLNGAQIRDGLTTMNKIYAEGSLNLQSFILDVGCGSGNVTRILASRLPHGIILSLDIDPAMVEFAHNNLKSNPEITFLVQDISLPFHNLSKALQSLEGQVDLVWSNRAMHWIPEKNQPIAFKNLFRLLKPGSKCYINNIFVMDFTEKLPEPLKTELRQIIRIPSEAEQLQSWKDICKNAGFASADVEFVQKSWTYSDHSEFLTLENVLMFFKRFITADWNDQKKEKFLQNKCKDIFLRSHASPIGAPLMLDLTGVTTSYYALFEIVCTKG